MVTQPKASGLFCLFNTNNKHFHFLTEIQIEPHAHASVDDSIDIHSVDNTNYEANGDSTDIHSIDITDYEANGDPTDIHSVDITDYEADGDSSCIYLIDITSRTWIVMEIKHFLHVLCKKKDSHF
jgi:hypothetical protein